MPQKLKITRTFCRNSKYSAKVRLSSYKYESNVVENLIYFIAISYQALNIEDNINLFCFFIYEVVYIYIYI